MDVIEQVVTDRYALYHGDCVEGVAKLPEDSIDMVIYSPPFCGLFNYSSSDRDMSNCRSYEEFFEHYRYLVENLSRVLKAGRICAVHCMDTPKQGANICGYRDFPGDLIRTHQEYGFEYLPRICIWKEPLAVRNRTMSKALAHRQIVEDSTKTNVASADYLIPFRLKGENQVPVTHEHGLTDYAGEREVPRELNRYRGWKGKQIENKYSHWIWRNYASCFWDDIRLDRTVQAAMKSESDEKHMHPLQLDVIERSCVLWSNPGETVLTPFMGVGSEVCGALLNDRRGVGFELKKAYFDQAVKNCEKILSLPKNGSESLLF